jgi:hypothetical protein
VTIWHVVLVVIVIPNGDGERVETTDSAEQRRKENL